MTEPTQAELPGVELVPASLEAAAKSYAQSIMRLRAVLKRADTALMSEIVAAQADAAREANDLCKVAMDLRGTHGNVAWMRVVFGPPPQKALGHQSSKLAHASRLLLTLCDPTEALLPWADIVDPSPYHAPSEEHDLDEVHPDKRKRDDE